VTLVAPRGTYDLLPPASATHLAVREALAYAPRLAGYGYVETPAFEATEVFARGVGESTDVVSKEMYTFEDRSGRSLTLRPEGTAPVVRAALEGNLHSGQLPAKLWYVGSFYRISPRSARRRWALRTRRWTPSWSGSRPRDSRDWGCNVSGCCSTLWATRPVARPTGPP
jgi:histidyl-tRNA synthetase